MSTRLHFGRSQDVRREALLPKYNWSGMVSATEAFCRPAPPVIEVLMRAVGVAVAKLFPEEFQQLQRDGNVKPEDCRLSVTVTVWGCATEIWWWRLHGAQARGSVVQRGPCTTIAETRDLLFLDSKGAIQRTHPDDTLVAGSGSQ